MTFTPTLIWHVLRSRRSNCHLSTAKIKTKSTLMRTEETQRHRRRSRGSARCERVAEKCDGWAYGHERRNSGNCSVEIFHSSRRYGKILRKFDFILPKFDFILPKFHFIPPKFYLAPQWRIFIFSWAIGDFLRRKRDPRLRVRFFWSIGSVSISRLERIPSPDSSMCPCHRIVLRKLSTTWRISSGR